MTFAQILSPIVVAAGIIGAPGLMAEDLKLALPSEGSDAITVLRDALEKCRDGKIQRLVLEPGIWNFYPDKADGVFRHISNHDPGYKRIAIHLDGFSDFEIDGSDSTLLCHGVIMPLVIDFSKNVTVKNLTIDWSSPFHLEGTVTNVGEDFFDVAMLPECGAVLSGGMLYGGMAEGMFGGKLPGDKQQDLTWNYWIDPVTRAAASKQVGITLWNKETKDFPEISKLSPNLFRIRNAHNRELPDKGSVMVCKGTNRLNRPSPAIHANGTDGLNLENITIHHAGGMGLIVEDCTDPVVKDFKVTLKPESKSLVTTTADATHFVGCRGTVIVENCLFENMLDDACNVHGIYAISEGMVAPDKLAVSFSHFQQLGTIFARAGDRIRFIKRDTLLHYGDTYTVGSINRENEDYYILTLDRPVTGYQENSSIENISTRPGLVFKGNTVRNNRARGILVTAGGKVVIEDNRFERPSMSAILIEGDNHVWYEAGAVEDVTIQNNTFIGHSLDAALFKLAPMQPGQTDLQAPYHHQIRITGNEIQAANPVLVEANRISGFGFSGNSVKFPNNTDTAGVAAFQMNACENISLVGNKFSQPVTIQTHPKTTEVKIEDCDGLSKN
ncbi:MAG: right-handed parallel beta-helix repeat-containing protein [Luteolibacter sp.]